MHDTLTLKLHFLSDWHIGEGAGARGHIDAIVRRDPADDLPYVPAKTLTGMLRDGCERVAYGLDNGDAKGAWHRLLGEIFGGNQEDPTGQPASAACLSIRPARLPRALRAAIQESAHFREALVFLKPGVKLDPYGGAESEMLRMQEMALAGAELCATAELAISDERRDYALALISAGAAAVERIGGKRRRGAGRCELRLQDGPTHDEILTRLQQEPPEVPQAADQNQSLTNLYAAPLAAQDAGWRRIALDLDLDSPINVPAESLGNLITTRDHIPGSLLLPALNHWLRKLLGERARQALASGAVQLRNAYPGAHGERLLPTPFALFKRKESAEFSNHLHRAPQDKHQRKQLRSGYVSRTHLPDNASGNIQVETTAITHATIQDETQRPSTDVGGVFTNQAIRPGQRLTAELWIREDLLDSTAKLSAWLKQHPSRIRIGRAKKDDYGRVSLSWRMLQQRKPDEQANQLIVWLASPLLLRDQMLAPVLTPEGVALALGKTLGVTLSVKKAMQRPWRDDGWNNAWGMRRPSRFGIAPGSCFVFQAAQPLDAAALARVEAAGLGERRGEGYGEWVLNAPLLVEQDDVPRKALSVDLPASQAAGPLQPGAFSQALQTRATRLMIRRKALEHDQQFRRSMAWRSGDNPKPPNTQLGALRALMESLHDPDGLARIRQWLNAVRENPKRNEKWPEKSKQKLAQHLDDPLAVWRLIGMANGPEPLPGQDAARLRDELRIEVIKTCWLTAISRQLNDNNRHPEPTHGA